MLQSQASMREMIEAVWRLPRDLVSDGYDEALAILGSQLPLQIHEYPSGTPCWTWTVPKKWTCHHASLETLDGRRVFSYTDNPLHVASYSVSVDAVLSREELLARLVVHPRIEDAVPFAYCFYRDDWALCCTKRQAASLTEEQYRVRIASSFTEGSLKVGECVLPGRQDECIVLCAHLDHPYQVNDGLSGLVVGMDVMRELARWKNRRYTYRLLIVPETIGSLAYLSHHPTETSLMRGGIFLEMLGLENPLSLQHSLDEESEFDRCCAAALHECDPLLRTGRFLRVVTNDERQFNAPGVRVPMVSVSRVENHCADSNTAVFPEYHSDHDNPALTSDAALAGARDAVLHMLRVHEENRVPFPRFQGEIFLSRYEITYDFEIDPDYGQALFEVMHRIDGQASLVDIADRAEVKVSTVIDIVKRFRDAGLVEIRDP